MANKTLIKKEIKRRLEEFNVELAIENSDNEAKTRMYLVEEFFQILGYNRGFENGNLIPEYDADFANLKGKKVDYAIQFRSKPEIIIEVKKAGMKLTDRHVRQLNEYFTNTNDSKIGILTNGIEYHFYCRNDNGHSGLHSSPFYSFDFNDIDGSEIETLTDFHATAIDVSSILERAQELFFIESFEKALYSELKKPSKEFIKAIYTNMGGSRLTDNIEGQIRGLINSVSIKAVVDKLVENEASSANSGIITTDDELRIYHIIKTILAQNRKIDTDRIGYRDYKGKFSILIDDNQQKKVCDLYITSTSRKIEIDGAKHEVSDIDSIVSLKKDLVKAALACMD